MTKTMMMIKITVKVKIKVKVYKGTYIVHPSSIPTFLWIHGHPSWLLQTAHQSLQIKPVQIRHVNRVLGRFAKVQVARDPVHSQAIRTGATRASQIDDRLYVRAVEERRAYSLGRTTRPIDALPLVVVVYGDGAESVRDDLVILFRVHGQAENRVAVGKQEIGRVVVLPDVLTRPSVGRQFVVVAANAFEASPGVEAQLAAVVLAVAQALVHVDAFGLVHQGEAGPTAALVAV